MTKTEKANGETEAAEPGFDRRQMLAPARLVERDFAWREWGATVPESVVDKVEDGRLWRLCSRRIQRGDRIQWRNNSLTKFGEIVCIASDVATGALEFRSMSSIEVAPSALVEQDIGEFMAVDAGIHDGWTIVRTADGHVMAKNFKGRDEAERRIRLEFIPFATKYAKQVVA